MNPKVQVEAEVLEVSARDYTGKDGSARSYRSAIIRLDGKMLAFTVGKEAFDSLKAVEGKTAIVVIEFSTFGNDLKANTTIVGVGKQE